LFYIDINVGERDMNYIPDEALVEAYFNALKYGLSDNFITLLYDEIKKRNIELEAST
jgi:hypothetical protein